MPGTTFNSTSNSLSQVQQRFSDQSRKGPIVSMRNIIIISILAFATVFYAGLLYFVREFTGTNLRGGISESASEQLVHRLSKVISIQQMTIDELSSLLADSRRSLQANSPIFPLSSMETTTSFEIECEQRYGMLLVQEWKRNKEVWCDSPQSQLVCYPYHQIHKRTDGKPPDMFCEATNFIIDFSKVHGEPFAKKPALSEQYLDFVAGSVESSCIPTDAYEHNLFMPHHKKQVSER